MRINVLDYYDAADWERIRAEADRHESPFLVVNLNIIQAKYEELRKYFQFAKIYYAVKANPAPEVITLLRDLGSCFDIASIYELDRVLSLGVSPDRISYGNTIKKARDVRYFYERGVRLFATDSEADVRNIAREAPGSRIFCRILTEGSETADWPLSRKFGCHPDMAIDLVLLARELGLEPCGISFHVGSQQRDIGAWDSAIAKVRYIFDYLKGEGVHHALINLGGNVLAVGDKPDDSPFHIGIQKPFDESGIPLTSVRIDDKSIVTSGTYQRYFEKDGTLYHHILDPASGYPCNNGLASVSIITDSSLTADALSTTCFLLGPEKGLSLVNQLDNVEAVFVDIDNQITYSNNFQK